MPDNEQENDQRPELCAGCGHLLEYFSGLEGIPEYLYCPVCQDWAYNMEGDKIAPLV